MRFVSGADGALPVGERVRGRALRSSSARTESALAGAATVAVAVAACPSPLPLVAAAGAAGEAGPLIPEAEGLFAARACSRSCGAGGWRRRVRRRARAPRRAVKLARAERAGGAALRGGPGRRTRLLVHRHEPRVEALHFLLAVLRRPAACEGERRGAQGSGRRAELGSARGGTERRRASGEKRRRTERRRLERTNERAYEADRLTHDDPLDNDLVKGGFGMG